MNLFGFQGIGGRKTHQEMHPLSRYLKTNVKCQFWGYTPGYAIREMPASVTGSLPD